MDTIRPGPETLIEGGITGEIRSRKMLRIIASACGKGGMETEVGRGERIGRERGRGQGREWGETDIHRQVEGKVDKTRKKYSWMNRKRQRDGRYMY